MDEGETYRIFSILLVDSSRTIQAIAVKTGWTNSAELTSPTYVLQAQAAGTSVNIVGAAQSVSIWGRGSAPRDGRGHRS